MAQKQAAVDQATNARNLLQEKSASVQRGIDEAEASLEKVQADNEGKETQLAELVQQKEEVQASMGQLQKDLTVRELRHFEVA